MSHFDPSLSLILHGYLRAWSKVCEPHTNGMNKSAAERCWWLAWQDFADETWSNTALKISDLGWPR